MEKELVMYGRRFACFDQYQAQNFLESQQIHYRFVDIGEDMEAAHRVETWVGHQSVPTFVIARPGEVLPVDEPHALDKGQRTRGQNRGTLITEPSNTQLAEFLRQHDLMPG